MSVRRQINRYRKEPSGYDYNVVLKKAKAFYRSSECFEIYPYRSPSDTKTLYTAFSETLGGFKRPKGTRIYKFDRSIKRWVEITEQKKE